MNAGEARARSQLVVDYAARHAAIEAYEIGESLMTRAIPEAAGRGQWSVEHLIPRGEGGMLVARALRERLEAFGFRVVVHDVLRFSGGEEGYRVVAS